jgi:hypothetical protein
MRGPSEDGSRVDVLFIGWESAIVWPRWFPFLASGTLAGGGSPQSSLATLRYCLRGSDLTALRGSCHGSILSPQVLCDSETVMKPFLYGKVWGQGGVWWLTIRFSPSMRLLTPWV